VYVAASLARHDLRSSRAFEDQVRAMPQITAADNVAGKAEAVGEGLVATAHDDGAEEQVALVDQPGLERLGGQVGTAHAEVGARRRLQLADRSGVEVPLDPGPRAGGLLQRRGVDDLVGPSARSPRSPA
jgi:hypothetical protein